MKLSAMLALTAALALGAIAAGCGGSDDDSSTSDLTKAEWIVKADTICKVENAKDEQKANELFGNQKPTQAQIQQFVTQYAIPGTEEELEKIRAIGAPSGDEDEVNKILDTAQAAVDKAKTSGDVNEQTFAEANTLAKQYGLKVCGQG